MSITEISDAAKNEIKSKSVLALGDTVTGKPAVVKSAIIEPVNVTVREINRIVGESNNSLREAVTDVRKFTTDSVGALKTELRGEYNEKFKTQGTRLEECETAAKADKFVAEVVYDMKGATADLNRGFPAGVRKGSKITKLNLSKYRYLIIDCQFDRNLTMLMDLTDINEPNHFYINSIAGGTERNKTYGIIAFEIIVDAAKTYVHLNNTSRSESYVVPSILKPDESAYMSKIIGII